MKRNVFIAFGLGLAGILCFPMAYTAEPTPVFDYDFAKNAGGVVKNRAGGLDLKLGADARITDGALVLNGTDKSFAAADTEAFRKWAKTHEVGEMSAAFWIRFDKVGKGIGSQGASLGLFNCFLNQDGKIAIRLFEKPTELLKPVTMSSNIRAEAGKWYHVEFSYSMNSRTYHLYIDGHYQMESDKLLLPEPAVGELKLGNGFCGAVKDLKFYNMALDSEELALSTAKDSEYDALAEKAKAVVGSTKNADLKNWAKELAARAAACKADKKNVSIAAFKRLSKSVNNAATLAAGINDAQNTVADQAVTAYVTPSTTQALYLPYDLPENGAISNKIEIVMAQDEFETASVVVVPFRPVKNFILKMGDLKNGSSVIKGSDVDIKLVKRWFRAGGAWMSYHVDLYMRVLTPDMLLNDDKLVQVDEFARTNKVLMHYPTGDQYVDVGKFLYNREWLEGNFVEWFYDAPTLQPMDLTEAGRNQQFVITIRANKDTKPGFYDGKLQMLADGKNAGTLNVSVRVLPFALPKPMAYYNSNMPYLSHVNSYDGVAANLKNAMDHNLMHLSGVANTPKRLKEAMAIGYPMDIVFDGPSFRGVEFGGPADKMTPAMAKRVESMMLAPFLRWQKTFEKYTGLKEYTVYRCQTSEASWYGAISLGPDQLSRLLNEHTHFKLFSHGMTEALPFFSTGIYDMNSSSGIKREFADIWHSIGGRSINYAFPFPGPENPGLMRRALGLELYKANLYDGHMMHGYVGRQLNEFTKYPGGDGDYRLFDLAIRQKGGCINSICIIGCREGYDDVRYGTMMKTLAEKAIRESKDELVIREAKRQLSWFERVNGDKMDMDDFRTNVQFRIMTLLNLIETQKGK